MHLFDGYVHKQSKYRRPKAPCDFLLMKLVAGIAHRIHDVDYRFRGCHVDKISKATMKGNGCKMKGNECNMKGYEWKLKGNEWKMKGNTCKMKGHECKMHGNGWKKTNILCLLWYWFICIIWFVYKKLVAGNAHRIIARHCTHTCSGISLRILMWSAFYVQKHSN